MSGSQNIYKLDTTAERDGASQSRADVPPAGRQAGTRWQWLDFELAQSRPEAEWPARCDHQEPVHLVELQELGRQGAQQLGRRQSSSEPLPIRYCTAADRVATVHPPSADLLPCLRRIHARRRPLLEPLRSAIPTARRLRARDRASFRVCPTPSSAALM